MRTKTCFFLLILFLSPVTVSSQQPSAVRYPFMNPDLSIQARVDDLLKRLTIEEKAAQMMHSAPAIERLGIPAYNWWNECLHGVARAGLATVFPQAIGIAATFNDSLVYIMADVISTEARAKYHEALRRGEHGIYHGLTFWSPNINIFRDPRWGRGMETYGEDPFLTGRIGVAFVKGLQGNDPKYLKTISTAKHYAVHSGPEPDRHRFNALTSRRDLLETYLPAFEALIREGGARSVMCAYNRYMGEPCCGNTYLLTDILRKQWGFDGYVVSDCWAVSDFWESHLFLPGKDESVARAVKSGTDLECGVSYGALVEAVKKGYITEKEIDKSLGRLIEARIRLGMFDPDDRVPFASVPYSKLDCEAHKQIALEMARESIVLLKNENNLLPLKKVKKIMVCGPNANDKPALLGNYNGTPSKIITPYEGIKELAGKKIQVSFFRGCDWTRDTVFEGAIEEARKADVIVMCGGITPELEGEEMPVKIEGFSGGDRTSLDLPKVQTEFLKALKATGKPVVLVLVNGSALSVNWENDNLPAIVEAWYGGQSAGTAVAEVLFGKYNPAGRLPVTFYKSVKDLPPFEDYTMEGRTYKYFHGKSLFPFGFGLSYTKFDYLSGELSEKQARIGDTLMMSVKVKNTGNYDGDETVQLYVSEQADRAGKPIKSLKGFKRVHIKSGETKIVNIALPVCRLQTYDEITNGLSVKPGAYEIMCGASSDDIRLTQELVIKL
jgi:beta-glucosidase